MKLFVGLGNVGARYARTRHNIGFMALDAIAAEHGFQPWRRKFQGAVAEGRLGSEKCVALKPATMMNLSGQSVGEAARFLKVDPADIIVFHDEIDLAPSRCRVKHGGGHAGHNGLRSIHQHLGPHYSRVRLGVGRPERKAAVAGYVLHDFAKADEAWLADLLAGVAAGAPLLAAGDDAGFMNAVALRTRPQRPKPAKPDRPAPDRPAADPAPPPSPAPPSAPVPDPAPSAPASDSPFARLLDRFRK